MFWQPSHLQQLHHAILHVICAKVHQNRNESALKYFHRHLETPFTLSSRAASKACYFHGIVCDLLKTKCIYEKSAAEGFS